MLAALATETLLDILQDPCLEKRDLKALRCVCRRLEPIARSLLFRNIVLSRRTADRDHFFSIAAHAHLAKCVRQLTWQRVPQEEIADDLGNLYSLQLIDVSKPGYIDEVGERHRDLISLERDVDATLDKLQFFEALAASNPPPGASPGGLTSVIDKYLAFQRGFRDMRGSFVGLRVDEATEHENSNVLDYEDRIVMLCHKVQFGPYAPAGAEQSNRGSNFDTVTSDVRQAMGSKLWTLPFSANHNGLDIVDDLLETKGRLQLTDFASKVEAAIAASFPNMHALAVDPGVVQRLTRYGADRSQIWLDLEALLCLLRVLAAQGMPVTRYIANDGNWLPDDWLGCNRSFLRNFTSLELFFPKAACKRKDQLARCLSYAENIQDVKIRAVKRQEAPWDTDFPWTIGDCMLGSFSSVYEDSPVEHEESLVGDEGSLAGEEDHIEEEDDWIDEEDDSAEEEEDLSDDEEGSANIEQHDHSVREVCWRQLRRIEFERITLSPRVLSIFVSRHTELQDIRLTDCRPNRYDVGRILHDSHPSLHSLEITESKRSLCVQSLKRMWDRKMGRIPTGVDMGLVHVFSWKDGAYSQSTHS